MDNKKSFLLYADMATAVSLLTDEQAGQVFKAIFAFHNGEEAKCADPMAEFYLQGTLLPMFQRDTNHYQTICDKRREAGRKGSAKRWDSKNSKCYSAIAKIADSDSDSDSHVSKETINKREKRVFSFNEQTRP